MVAYLIGVALFAAGIAVTIALHELGHLGAARLCGMKVRRYFVGFGPKIWSTTRGGTEYGLKALPFGGFCEIAGMTALDEVTPEEAPYAMVNKPWWQRIFVLLGGIAVNILVGLILLYGVATTAGIPNLKADMTPIAGELVCAANQLPDGTLASCNDPSPAAVAGLMPGDRIQSVDGQPLTSFVELRDYVTTRAGEIITLTVSRGPETLQLDIQVATVTRYDSAGVAHETGAIGVVGGVNPDAIKRYDAVSAIPATLAYSAEIFKGTATALVQLPAKVPGVAAAIFGGQRDAESPMSVVGASRVGGELVERSLWSLFFMMLASLNFFLALFNLIPLPPFDGGHVVVVLYEKLRDFLRRLRGLAPGQPADYTKLLPITYAIAAVLISVSVIFVLADIVNPIRLFG
ncbi:M50 family metallopeptidase [Corynebacterium caspium]|uniref:M50 family metallopeptidase n=1 Tax=Corynebacterium caspium TaxID=234828 RepID=UPI00037C693F|nr:site-2 protease family protein [Corynebacterium caspium]WKD59075.1 Zinc metalloprotease Rip1 [Corynebacterium caspium DSM 44850]